MKKKDFLSAFFNSLNSNEICYFIYGDYRNLPTDTAGGDIDIYVAEKYYGKFEKLLHDLTKNASISQVSSFANANAIAKFRRYFYYAFNECWGVQIDAPYQGLCHKGTQFFPLEKLQPYIINHNGVRVLDIRKGFYVGFLKEILHLGKAKDKYVIGFIDEVAKNPDSCCQELTELYGADFTDCVLNNLTIDELTAKSKQLGDLLFKAVHRNDFWHRQLTRLRLMKRFLYPNPGYVIAVLGTDGSGKSAIISAITPLLLEAFHGTVFYNHLRPNWLPDIGVLLGKREKSSSPVDKPHAQHASGLFISLLRWSYYLFDYTLGYYRKIWLPVHTGSKVFIFDRYYYDYSIDQKRSRINLPHWLIRLGEFFVPTPDIILCLGGNPETIYTRKPETSLNEVARQVAALKQFCLRHKNAVWIDTTKSLEKSVDDALRAIHEVMKKRFANTY